MEKTRKAFVVLAAAVTAGQIGCGSSTKESTPDAKPADTARLTDTAKASDTAIPVDTAKPVGADAAIPDTAPAKDAPLPLDTAAKDAPLAPDVPSVDTGSDAMGGDALSDAVPRPDTVADTIKPDVKLVPDASTQPPDAPGPLIMPAGTIYDVLTLADVA